ncbi:protein obstructor-E-like, partial [Limulus polyphemus]|uniref:Protein obstructor-E-like n=1 Tax=Limulus polyphemus TaxID=6850 RepID=A0ABM1C1T3_LIMPO
NGQCHEANGFFPNQQQCDSYYICRNGTLTEGLCPDGLAFNVRGSYCDSIRNVDCSDRPQLQQPQPTEWCPRRWGEYPHESDCTRFLKCVDGKSYEFPCPEGLAYSYENGYCDWPDLVHGCDSEAIVGFTCPVPTYEEIQNYGNQKYPDPHDCRRYYVCVSTYDDPTGVKRLPRLQTCEHGQVFNQATLNCDYSVNVPGCESYYGPAAKYAVPVQSPLLAQYVVPKTPIAGQYDVTVKAPVAGLYDASVKTPIAGQYDASVKTPISGQYDVPVAGQYDASVKTPIAGQYDVPVAGQYEASLKPQFYK